MQLGLKDIPYLGYIITWEGIKTDPKKLQGIIDIARPTTTTEARSRIGMVQYYMDMWPRRSHVLDPMMEAAIGPKGREILWNDDLEVNFREIKCMVSAETLHNYPDYTIPLIVHTNTSDKQLGAVISKNCKPIAFFLIKLSKPQCTYTTTEKELLSILECLKQLYLDTK